MKHCENCGCKVYKNGCVNCNEESYIYDQYIELEMEVPKLIEDKRNEQQKTEDIIKKMNKSWRPM